MPTILFVDDDEFSGILVSEVLSGRGYLVIWRDNLIDGREVLENFPIDLVICDINFGDGTRGFDFVRHIRLSPAISELPVAMISARRSAHDVELAMRAGTDEYLIKPIDTEVLVSKVEVLLSRSRTWRERSRELSPEESASIELLGISENGVRIKLPFAVDDGVKVQIRSAIFEKIGIANPWIHILPTSGGSEAEALFIGMTSSDAQKIRAWMTCQSTVNQAIRRA